MSSDLGDFIRQQRETAAMSVRRLAELAEVSNPYLSQIERGLRKPSAGILDPEASALLSVPDAIHRDPRLTNDQKRSLLTVYESFVGDA